MVHRPPTAQNLAQDSHLDRAYAALQRDGAPEEAGAAQHEHGEDQLLAELEQALQRATELLAQLRSGQKGEQQPEADGEPTGSPSAQGMAG